MPKKSHNKCVHMTEREHKQLELAGNTMDRSCSQLIHDALTVALFKPGGMEERLAASRLEQAREFVSDSIHSPRTFDFFGSESSQRTDDPRFSRLMSEAFRPEVLHG